MQSFLLKHSIELVKMILRESKAKKARLSNLPESLPKYNFTSCQDFSHQNF